MLFLAAVAPAAAEREPRVRLQVWALDQSDTDPAGGGLLYRWSQAALLRRAQAARPAVLNLADAARAAGCPVGRRPHMTFGDRPRPSSHVVVANVGSGSTFFMDAQRATVVGCVSTLAGFGGAGGSVSAHAAVPSPNGSMVIVADIGAPDQSGFLHKIRTDYARNSYTLVETLPLAPQAAALGTLARPICHDFTRDGRFAYVTIAGGGVLVVDVGTADSSVDMSVRKVYPASMVPAVGCGAFTLPDGRMLVGTERLSEDPAAPPSAGVDRLYLFDARRVGSGAFPDPVVIPLPGVDSHGVATCADQQGRLYAWVVMRLSDHVNVVDLRAGRVVATHSLARPFSPNPTPDLIQIRGRRAFITLRGPRPLTAIPNLQFADRTPGVAVLRVARDCRTFRWARGQLASMSDANRTTTLTAGPNTGAVVTAADPHGIDAVVTHAECTIDVRPRRLRGGEPTRVRATVRLLESPLAAARVRVWGAGVSRTLRTDANGQAAGVVRPRRAGTLRLSVRRAGASLGCRVSLRVRR